jgi:integrase
VGLQCHWVQAEAASLIVPREHTTKKQPITIPLTKRASDIIRRYFEHGHSPYLFVSTSGRPYTCSQVNRALQRAAKSSGVQEICLYTLRHTFISRLVQGGATLAEVATLAGHQDVRMTMRYAHLAPHHLYQGISKLEAHTTTRNENVTINNL